MPAGLARGIPRTPDRGDVAPRSPPPPPTSPSPFTGPTRADPRIRHIRSLMCCHPIGPGPQTVAAGGVARREKRRPPPGGRAGVAVRSGPGGAEPVPSPMKAYAAVSQSYQPVMQRQLRTRCIPLCCRTVGSSVESDGTIAAAFFDLDKTIISRSSTLAFGPSFYRHGLITRGDAIRTAFAQLVFRLGGADHQRMERIRAQVGDLCRGWSADRVSEIVGRHLNETILPLVYADARRLIAAHGRAGQDVIIVSTSGLEMVGPIGDLLGASEVIATRMEVADGCYTGEMEFWAYGEAKAQPGAGAGGQARLPAPRLLRVQRLDHRPADAGGRGPSPGGEPRPGAAAGGPGAAVAGARVRTAVRCLLKACEHANPSRSRIGHAPGFTSPRIRRRKK